MFGSHKSLLARHTDPLLVFVCLGLFFFLGGGVCFGFFVCLFVCLFCFLFCLFGFFVSEMASCLGG